MGLKYYGIFFLYGERLALHICFSTTISMIIELIIIQVGSFDGASLRADAVFEGGGVKGMRLVGAGLLREHPVGRRYRSLFGDNLNWHTEGFGEWISGHIKRGTSPIA